MFHMLTSRYQSNSGDAHWVVVKNILKYFRRTKDQFIVYGGPEELIVNGYTDASFQTDKDDSQSQSGYVINLNGGVVSWKSSKHETVADSTMEAGYIAASEATKEAIWITKFISELGVVPSCSSPMTSIVTIMVLLHKQRSLGHTKNPSIYCGAIT